MTKDDTAAPAAGATRRWILGAGGILVLHALWLAGNRVPPAWDMAYHQLAGWELARALSSGRWELLWQGLSDYYPPLYYWWEAAVFLVCGPVPWIAGAANLPGLLLLSYATYRLATRVAGAAAAVAAGWLVLLFPLLAWSSRETLIDPSLAGVTALGLLALVRLQERAGLSRAVAFGMVSAAGMWLKWTYPLFLAFPVAVAWFRSERRRETALRLLDSALIAAPLVAAWYLPHLADLQARFRATAGAAAWEGDPPWYTVAGLLYYPRVLSGYYLFLPLTALALVAALRAQRNGSPPGGRAGARLVAAALLGGLVLLTCLPAKDPRYAMPLAAPLAVWLVTKLQVSDRLRRATLALALLQFLAASFVPIPWKWSLFGEPDPCHYRNTAREWVWFSTHYYCVMGAPRREDWGYQRLLELLPAGARVGFVPEHARFHLVALQLAAAQQERRLQVFRLGDRDDWPRTLAAADWVVGKTGDQGIDVLTRFNGEVYEALQILHWPVVAEWELPDGSRARLWRNPAGPTPEGGTRD
ncbi:MAG: hypothetical protein Kow00109_16020 [Acidobacteriota bacterium]